MGARTVSTESRNSESVSPGHKRSGQKDASATAQSFIRKLSSKGKKMTVAGAVLSAIFGFASITTATGSLWMLPALAWYLEAIVPVLCFFAAGEASGANDNKPLAESPMEIIKGADFLAEKPNER